MNMENAKMLQRHQMSKKRIEEIEAYATMPESRVAAIVWDEENPFIEVAFFYAERLGYQTETVTIYHDKPGTTTDLGGTPVAMALAA